MMSGAVGFIALHMKWAEDRVHAEIIEESLVMASVLNYKTLRQLAILILIAMIFSAPASAQDCTPDEITLFSQAEVNNFQINHGPCDTVTEGLYINGNDIVDLSPLSALTTVGGDILRGGVFIWGNTALTNLNGLSALTRVDGFFEIFNNTALTNLNSLSALTSVGYFTIFNNPTLANLDGLSGLTTVRTLTIEYNTALTNLNGLSALTSAVNLQILNNPTLANLDGLSGLTTVPGTFSIRYNTALTNLEGLSGLTNVGYLGISYNNALANFDSLSGLTTVRQNLTLGYNTALTNIDGLSALTSVGSLGIWDNPTLANLNGLSALTSLRFDLNISNNAALTNLNGLSALTSVGGTLNIRNNTALTNLNGLSALTTVGDTFSIVNNSVLTNLNGLSALTTVDRSLSIRDNTALTNLNGLSALISVGGGSFGGGIYVRENMSLNHCLGIVVLVDPIDDYEPGPGPGASGIPDVADQVTILNNLDGCNSVLEILGKADLLEMNAGLNDAWFNLETNGQGFFIIVSPEIKQIFLAWFTYDTERPPEDVTAILGEPGHRWLTAQGEYEENVALLDVYITSGGVFDSPEPETVTEPDGEIMLEFSTCNAGTITYDIPSIDRQGVVPIERIVLDNVELCYVLGKQVEAEAALVGD
jgi:hypothetical protein